MKQYELYLAEDNLSNDSLDADYGEQVRLNLKNGEINEEECMKEPQPWVVEKINQIIIARKLIQEG